jgi:zinc protease
MRLGGLVTVSATVQAGHDPKEVAAALAAEIKALRDAPPTPDEMERVKRNIRAQLFAQLENTGGFGGKADLLNEYEFRAGDPGQFSRQIEKVLAVTPEDVQKIAQKYLGEDNRVTITVLPEEGGQ